MPLNEDSNLQRHAQTKQYRGILNNRGILINRGKFTTIMAVIFRLNNRWLCLSICTDQDQDQDRYVMGNLNRFNLLLVALYRDRILWCSDSNSSVYFYYVTQADVR